MGRRQEFPASGLDSEGSHGPGLEQVSDIAAQSSAVRRRFRSHDELRVARAIFDPSLKNWLDACGPRGQDLPEHGLVTQFTGGHVDDICGIDEAPSEFAGVESTLSVAAGNQNNVNAGGVLRSQQSGHIPG